MKKLFLIFLSMPFIGLNGAGNVVSEENVEVPELLLSVVGSVDRTATHGGDSSNTSLPEDPELWQAQEETGAPQPEGV